MKYSLRRDTAFPIILNVSPAKTQISLRIRAVWSESSQGAQSVFKSTATTLISSWAVRMRRLIWVFTGRAFNLVGEAVFRLIWNQSLQQYTNRFLRSGFLRHYIDETIHGYNCTLIPTFFDVTIMHSEYYPAGTWRLYNVGSTSMQRHRHDVASTLRRHCINVICPLGKGLDLRIISNWLLIWAQLFKT